VAGLSTAQWLALDEVAGDIADGTIRLTTRQAVQFHGVLKQGLRPTAFSLDEHLMTSFGACGDVVRKYRYLPGLDHERWGRATARDGESDLQGVQPKTMAHWEIS